jgi:branched-subunit amino acid transport protein
VPDVTFLKSNYAYGLYAIVLAVVSIFTREIVTFIMLGFVFMALMNINATLQKLVDKTEKRQEQ